MLTKQQVEREILELNAEYNQRKEKLNHKLFELMQLEKRKTISYNEKRNRFLY